MDESETPGAIAAPLPAPQQSGNPAASPDAMQASLPALAGMLTSLYASRAPLASALDAIDAEIKRVEMQAHQAMATLGVQSFRTQDAGMELKPQVVYNPTDWPAIYDHIQTTGEFDLLHRALTQSACRERGEELPPGILRATFDKFKFTPSKR